MLKSTTFEDQFASIEFPSIDITFPASKFILGFTCSSILSTFSQFNCIFMLENYRCRKSTKAKMTTASKALFAPFLWGLRGQRGPFIFSTKLYFQSSFHFRQNLLIRYSLSGFVLVHNLWLLTDFGGQFFLCQVLIKRNKIASN